MARQPTQRTTRTPGDSTDSKPVEINSNGPTPLIPETQIATPGSIVQVAAAAGAQAAVEAVTGTTDLSEDASALFGAATSDEEPARVITKAQAKNPFMQQDANGNDIGLIVPEPDPTDPRYRPRV